MSDTKKKRKGLGCFGALLVFVLVVALIIGAIVGVFAWLNAREQAEITKELQSQIFTMDASAEIEAYLESLKEIPSDIAGKTQYEKYEMGLIPSDGSDSDGDGLTDQEELEQYKTDPLKASTSGDGIPDGMKLKAGLELTGVYGKNSAEYASFVKQVVPYDNVVLKDKATAKNALSHVREKERCAVSGAIAVKAYKVYSYTGTGEIDFSAFMEDGVEYAGFMVGDGIADEVKSLRIWNGKVTFKASGANCTVGIYAKPGTENTVPSLSQLQESGISSGNDAMIFMAPIVAVSGEPIPIVIWERNPLLAGAKYKIENSTLAEQLGLPGVSTTLEYIYLDSIRYDLYHGLLNKAFSFDWMQDYVNENGAEMSDEQASIVKDILSYSVIFFNIEGGNWDEFNDYLENKKDEFEDNVDNPDQESDSGRPSKYVTSFDPEKDVLPFRNFGNYLSEGGVCPGFAFAAMHAFTGVTYEKSAVAVFEDKIYRYDLTGTVEYESLFDRYLCDCKYESYWRDTYETQEILTQYGVESMVELPREAYSPEDAAFIDFLGYKWQELNERVSSNWRLGDLEMNWSLFEKMISYFENNDRPLYIRIGSGDSLHEVLAYGVEPDPMDSDVWYILLYDNNFPGEMIVLGDEIYYSDNRIKVTKEYFFNGIECAEWHYYPLPGRLPDYLYTSYFFSKDIRGGWHTLVAYDESYNIIFE